jgi:hypothetical protein
VVERRPLDREIRGSNMSSVTMALLLTQYYEYPKSGIIKGTLLLLHIEMVIMGAYVRACVRSRKNISNGFFRDFLFYFFLTNMWMWVPCVIGLLIDLLID